MMMNIDDSRQRKRGMEWERDGERREKQDDENEKGKD